MTDLKFWFINGKVVVSNRLEKRLGNQKPALKFLSKEIQTHQKQVRQTQNNAHVVAVIENRPARTPVHVPAKIQKMPVDDRKVQLVLTEHSTLSERMAVMGW